MSPTLNREMREVLETLELDDEVKVLVLTGAGESWTAGMDLKEYFREVDQAPEIVQEQSPARRIDVAMEAAADVCQADDRDGERLVLRRRIFAAGRVRPGDRCGDRSVRTVGDQLGHSAGQPGEQGACGYGGAAQGARVHHDGRDVYGNASGGDGTGKPRGSAREAARGERSRWRASWQRRIRWCCAPPSTDSSDAANSPGSRARTISTPSWTRRSCAIPSMDAKKV